MILERAAHAKINLGLHVLRQRSDGYHDIETVFLRVPPADLLSVEPAETLSFTCSDPSLPVDEGNLCVRAARSLMSTIGEAKGGALHLEKRIPFGAGLGGGSSDAAATLLLLRDFWRLDVDDVRLADLAATLGSDVPFFLHEAAAYATGRGEILEPLVEASSNEIYRFPFSLLIVAPEVHVSTAEAYRNIVPREVERPDLKTLVSSNDLELWRNALENDFEASVFRTHPVLADFKARLYEAGAGYAAMTGSGSALFGVFESKEDGLDLASSLRREGVRSFGV